MEYKKCIVVCQYGGQKYIVKEFEDIKEALSLMGNLLDKDAKRKGRGARLTVRLFEQYGVYSN